MSIDLRLERDDEITEEEDRPPRRSCIACKFAMREGTKKSVSEEDPEKQAERKYENLMGHHSTVET